MGMMGRVLIGAVGALAFAWSSTAQEPFSDDRPECHWPAGAPDQWNECAAAANSGSPLWVLAHMNLGTIAFFEHDFESAAHHYDLSKPGASESHMSDPFLHAFRSATFLQVGRQADALEDARVVLTYIERDVSDVPADSPPLDDADLIVLYESILEVLVTAEAPEAAQALAAFRILPAVTVDDVMNRAAVFTELGLYDEAEVFSEAALERSKNDPGALNNHCYLLTLMGRAGEAIGYCEQAVVGMPDEPAVLHSYAAVLAAMGRCDEAEDNRRRAAELHPSIVEYQTPLVCDAPAP